MNMKYKKIKSILCCSTIMFLVSTTMYGQQSDEHKSNQNEIKFQKHNIADGVRTMPRFPGCEDLKASHEIKYQCASKQMLEYIYSRLVYPKAAKKEKIKGVVVVSFTIEIDGTISDIKLVRDIGGGCGEEAIRIFEEMQASDLRWVPATLNGEPISTLFNMPVKF